MRSPRSPQLLPFALFVLLSLLGNLPEVHAEDGLCANPQQEVQILSHTNGDLVDSSENGFATGGFYLSGSAPPNMDTIAIALDGETGTVSIDEDASDNCQTMWFIEINAIQTTTVNILISAASATMLGNKEASVALNIVAAGREDRLVQPAFAFTPQFHDRVLEYNSTTGIIIFDGDVSGSVRPNRGLGSDMSPVAPTGYLRIVLSVTFDGANTTVETRQAGMYEFLRRMGANYSDSLDGFDLGSEGVNVTDNNSTALATSDAGRRRNLLALGPNTELTFSASVNPDASLTLDIDWEVPDCWFCIIPIPTVKTFAYEIKLELKLAAKLKHTVEELVKEEGKIGKGFEDKFATISFPSLIPGIPIIITFELDAQPFYKVSVEYSMVWTYEEAFVYAAGYEYKSDGSGRGGYKVEPDAPSPNSPFDADLGITAAAEVGIEIDFEGLLYGSAGVELEFSPKLVLEASTDLINCEIKWGVSLQIPIEAGLSFEIEIGPIDWELEVGDFTIGEISFVIFEGKKEFPGSEMCPDPLPSASPSNPPTEEPPTNPPQLSPVALSPTPTECVTFICCEEDCCGPRTTYRAGSCESDPSNGLGWTGENSAGYDDGCIVRTCCEDSCCTSPAIWDGSFCVG